MNTHIPQRLPRLRRLVAAPSSLRVAALRRLRRLALAFGWESLESPGRRDSRKAKQGAISPESRESPRGLVPGSGRRLHLLAGAAMAKRCRPPARPASSRPARKPLSAARVAEGCQSRATRPVETLP
jgi:hypothetical protein